MSIAASNRAKALGKPYRRHYVGPSPVLTKTKLSEWLRARGMNAQGTKDELYNRIKNHPDAWQF